MSWAWFIGGLMVLSVTLTGLGIGGWLQISHWRFVRYHAYKGTTLDNLGAVDFGRLHLREGWAWVVLGWWTVTAFWRDGLIEADPSTGPTVVCVHGFTQSGSNFWGIRKTLRRRGRSSRAMYLGRPLQPLTGYTLALRDVLADGDEPVDVVCHSMGGVILRMVLADEPEIAHRIRRIVTLGSPHRGTAGPRGFALFADIQELSRSSAVLADLPTFDTVAPEAEVTTIAAVRDFVVYPRSSALLPGTEQVVLPGVGHGGLLVHRESIEAVCRALSADELTP